MAAVSTPALNASFRAPDFSLKATDGRCYGLADFRNWKAFLVMFICNHCPYVKSIVVHLVADVRSLMRDYGVAAVAVMPNDTDAYPEDSYEKMVSFANLHGFPFPYLIDEDQTVAKAYGAVGTPDFFIFNDGLELCYRGRFGGVDAGTESSGESELFRAAKFISEKGRAPEGQVPSIGCSIKWRDPDGTRS